MSMGWGAHWGDNMYRGLVLCSLMASSTAFAQTLPESADGDTGDDTIVVRGYAQSLQSAAAAKRASNNIVEVIEAEDIADFPDLNLAEALQRVPGVAIDREGGEGRSITVRGLSADFTRVRLNGLEALATTGGKDQASGQGSANRGRGFDFHVFAAELFERVTVRKSQAAEVEEGSLGATVDLETALPFDYPGLAGAMSVEYGYNDLSRTSDPRISGLLSNTWADGRIGALLSVAYSSRRAREEGASSGRWENPSVPTNSGGCFQSPGPCNDPPGTYSAVNSAWHARIPRYGRLDYDFDRLGVTAAVQLRPTDRTLVTISGLYADLSGTREEHYLETFLSRGNKQGVPAVDVLNPVFNDKNELVSATFNDVDIRSEARFDKLSSKFVQGTIKFEQEIGDRLHLTAQVGQARSVQNNPVQMTISLDRYDVDGYGYDFSNPKRPALSYPFDVTDPANWSFTTSNAQGDSTTIRLRPNRTTNRIRSGRLDARFDVNDALQVKAGVLVKRYDFATTDRRRYTINGITEGGAELPAGVTIADISSLVTGFGRGFGVPAITPTTWLAPDIAKINALFDIDCNCINQYGDFRISADNNRGANRDVSERDLSGYVQLDFSTAIAGMRLRGNVGARYAHTYSRAGGFVGSGFVRLGNGYDDFLPAVNFVLEPRRDVVVRLSAAKVMSRPQLPTLTPGGSISNTGLTLSVGNPKLDPIRAKTLDLNVEWYPDRETQISAGLFYKDISSYIQNSTVTVPFSATGLPTSLLTNGNTPETIFALSQVSNTNGGKLRGAEVSIQRRFNFLPAPFDHFGGIANYTRVKSKVAYIVDASQTPALMTTLPLAGLSPTSWNATLYYEDARFGARVSGAYRAGYLSGVPGGNGNDARGKLHSLTIDAAATFNITEKATITFQGLNLTDASDNRWIDRGRMDIEESSHTGRQFYLGIRYRL